MLEWLLPTIGASVFGAMSGGGGGEFTPEQRRLFSSQADIAELMRMIMQNRQALTGPNLVNGELSGPMVEALTMAMNNARRAQAQPRTQVQNATPFDPYAALAQRPANMNPHTAR